MLSSLKYMEADRRLHATALQWACDTLRDLSALSRLCCSCLPACLL